MRVAISTDGKYVSPHFGRCTTYTLVDVVNGKTVKREEVNNSVFTGCYPPVFTWQRC